MYYIHFDVLPKIAEKAWYFKSQTNILISDNTFRNGIKKKPSSYYNFIFIHLLHWKF